MPYTAMIQRVTALQDIVFNKSSSVPRGSLGWVKDVLENKTETLYTEWDNGVSGYVHEADLRELVRNFEEELQYRRILEACTHG